MSNLLYHKELTEAQWGRIKFLFEEPKKVGRPSLNPRTVLNGILKLVNRNAADSTLLEIDSTFCKVHQSGCSGLKNQAIGSACVGKIHDSEPVIALQAKKFSQIVLTVVINFTLTLSNAAQSFVFPTKQILR